MSEAPFRLSIGTATLVALSVLGAGTSMAAKSRNQQGAVKVIPSSSSRWQQGPPSTITSMIRKSGDVTLVVRLDSQMPPFFQEVKANFAAWPTWFNPKSLMRPGITGDALRSCSHKPSDEGLRLRQWTWYNLPNSGGWNATTSDLTMLPTKDGKAIVVSSSFSLEPAGNLKELAKNSGAEYKRWGDPWLGDPQEEILVTSGRQLRKLLRQLVQTSRSPLGRDPLSFESFRPLLKKLEKEPGIRDGLLRPSGYSPSE